MPTTDTAVMTTQEVADRFYELARDGQWTEIQEELFASNVVSIEPAHVPPPQMTEGKEAIKKKAEMFQDMVEEIHGGYSTKPLVAGTHFAVGIGLDATMKGRGRMKMDEIGVYEVKDGKIVKEQFLF